MEHVEAQVKSNSESVANKLGHELGTKWWPELSKVTEKQEVKESRNGLDDRIDLVLDILRGKYGYDYDVKGFARTDKEALGGEANSFDLLLISIVIKTLAITKDGRELIENYYIQQRNIDKANHRSEQELCQNNI